ncbi:hypothetical protein JCM9279_000541 [Rhodotorula babjevae]
MPRAAQDAARASSPGPAPPARTLLDLTNELHKLHLDAIGLKLVDPALAHAVRRFADRVTKGVGNWPVWHALATLQDDTVTPPRSLQSSVFHVVDIVQLGLLHSTITSSAEMAPAFAAVEHIIHAVPSFTSAPHIVPSSSRQSSAQPRLHESFAAFEAVLVQLSRVRPTQPLAGVALAEVSKATEELEAAVPSSTAWEALSVVKPRGGLPGPHSSRSWTDCVNAILGIINEGKQLAGDLKAWRSLSKRAPAEQLVSARTAARYRVSQEDLARRWR